jgi:signal recognition particle GTPase
VRNSEKTALKIKELEAALVQAHAAIPEAEKGLANAHAEGGNTAKAHDALVAARDAVPALIGALSALDRRYFDEASQEFTDVSMELSKAAESAFRKASTDLDAALKPVGKTLVAAGVQASVLQEITETLRRHIWEALDNAAGVRLHEHPKPPRPIQKRDPVTGKKVIG